MKYLLTFFSASILTLNISSQNILTKDLLSSGATMSSNQSYHLTGSIGQASVGELNSSNITATIGFWAGILDNSTSVHEINNHSFDNLIIKDPYPNPSSSLVNLEISVPRELILKITLHTINGFQLGILEDFNFSPGKFIVGTDVSAFPSGIYIIRIESDNSIVSKSILINH